METFTHSFISLSLIFLVSALAVVVVYRVFPRRGSARPASRLEVSPQDLGSFSYRQLILVSVLSLFLEMLMIRWISSEIRIFAYFKNFVLIACFLGFGLGCSLCRRKIFPLTTALPVLFLTVLVGAPIAEMHKVVTSYSTMIGSSSQIQIWGLMGSASASTELTTLLLAIFGVAPLFGCLVFMFLPVGQLVGGMLERA